MSHHTAPFGSPYLGGGLLAATLAATLVVGLGVGCGGRSVDLPPGGTVDTLAGGVVWSRSADEGLWASGQGWRLVEELRIGSVEGGGPTVFGDVVGVAVGPEGTIYVLDGLARQLRSFTREGIHRWSVGREGQGPGEFRRPVGVAVDPAGLVWVVDAANRRYTAFDAAGTWIRDVPRPRGGPATHWRGRFDHAGRLLDPSYVSIRDGLLGDGIVRTDPSLRASDSLSLPDLDRPTFPPTRGGGVSFAVHVPFAPGRVWTPGPSGNVWISDSDPYVLALTSFEGDTVRVVERRVSPLPLSAEDRTHADSVVQSVREDGGRPDPSLVPETKPRVRWIEAAPDGHLWVRVASEAKAVAYDVFTPEGRYLGEVASPVDFEEGLAFTDDGVAGVVLDSLGVPFVVRLRLESSAASPS